MRKQAFTIAALVLCAQAALASAPDLNVQLNLLESKVTGKAHPNLSLSERVAALEQVVHGQVRTGSLVKRVKDLADVTGGSTIQNFKPPELPKVDTSAVAPESSSTASKATAPHSVAPPARSTASASNSTSTSTSSSPSAGARGRKPTAANQKSIAAGKSNSTNSSNNSNQPTMKARVEDDIRLGMQHHNSGNIAAAKAAFRRALRFDPKNVNAHFNMGVICEETGDLPRALAHYQAAAEGAPNDAEIQDAVVSLQRKLGNTAGASSAPQYGSNAQPFSDQSPSTSAASFSYEPTSGQYPGSPAPAPDFRQSGYQSGPFYAGNPNSDTGTPLLQGQAQQADLASGASQNNLGINNAPFSGVGTAQQQNVPPLSANSNSGSLNSGAAQSSHPGRRKFLQSAATAVGLGAVSIGSGLVRSRSGFGGGGLGVLHCPVCSWLNRF